MQTKIYGTARPFCELTVFADEEQLRTVTTNGNGEFSFYAQLSAGEHTIHAEHSNGSSNEFTITVEDEAEDIAAEDEAEVKYQERLADLYCSMVESVARGNSYPPQIVADLCELCGFDDCTRFYKSVRRKELFLAELASL